ncbi:MAG: kelch motif-containing protein, partial [Myxococcota bacterium]|nr:kelch motif-containing protein [Myxococcota bacterium]
MRESLPLLLILSSLACSVESTPDDAGSALDAGSDGGPSFDPRAVRWETIELGEVSPDPSWGAMVADLGDGTAVLIGGTSAGSTGGRVYDSAFRIDARGAAVIATEIVPSSASAPAPRYCGCATWDAARSRVIVVGGRDLTGPFLAGETWALDPESGAWSLLADAASTPPGVIGCAMAHSRSRGATYLFGGGGAGGFTDTTWRLDPESDAWTQLTIAGESPSARYDAVMLPVDGGARLVLHAGSFGATGGAFFSDVWTFDVASESWAEQRAEGAEPRGRRAPWSRLDPTGGGFYAGMGYDFAMEPVDDLWHFDLATRRWTAIELDVDPGARGFAPALPAG